MLELGKAGSAGAKGVLPVLRDGAVVATLRAANWKEQATAVIGDREWVYAKVKRELTGRWAADPQATARLHARQTSWWKGSWAVELEGRALEVRTASMWKGTHRYLASDRQLAESGRTGGWSPRPTLTADDALPLDHQVFLLWLELIISRRNAAAAGAVGAAGAGAAVVAGGS
jgi:hypothetical protein